MSYQDIEYHLENGGTVHYDKESAVQYLTYVFARVVLVVFYSSDESKLTQPLDTARANGSLTTRSRPSNKKSSSPTPRG